MIQRGARKLFVAHFSRITKGECLNVRSVWHLPERSTFHLEFNRHELLFELAVACGRDYEIDADRHEPTWKDLYVP